MMVESISGLLQSVDSLEARLLVTGGMFMVLAGIGWVAKRGFLRYGSAKSNRIANAVTAVILFLIAGAATLVLFNLWNITITDIVDQPLRTLTRVIVSVALVVGVYVLTGVLQQVVHDFVRDQTTVTEHQTELAFRSVQVALYILVAIVVLGIWRVNLGGLLIGAGFLGIVVGLAARQTLGALIAGFVLMFSRPFEIGDWVSIGDREGIVTEISIVNTRIQTFDGEYAMMPNDLVASTEIINRTRKGRLRLHLEVGIDYSSDIEQAREIIKKTVRDIDEVLTVPQPDVVVTEFGNSAVILDIRFWIDNPSSRRRWRAQNAVMQAVKAAFDREGIKIPFPQRELSGRAETGGFQIADTEVQQLDHPRDPAPDGGDT